MKITKKDIEFAKKVLAVTQDYKKYIRCNSYMESDDYTFVSDNYIDRIERWCKEYLGESGQ